MWNMSGAHRETRSNGNGYCGGGAQFVIGIDIWCNLEHWVVVEEPVLLLSQRIIDIASTIEAKKI